MKQEELEMAASICAAKTLGRNEGKKNAAVKARAMYYCKECFKAGAEWQRNHVWHSNTEMPSDGIAENGDGKMCLVIKNKKPFVSKAHQSRAGNYYFCDEGVWRPIDSIDTWAYLSDLTPTSFDEIIEANKDVLQRLKDE